MHFSVYQDRAGEWRWTLYAANNRKIANSGEGCKNKSDCESAIKLVKSAAEAQVRDSVD